jgi:hypothetical protein
MTNQNNSFCGKGLIKLQPLVEQEMISFPEHPVFILLNFKEQGLYNYRHV